MLLLEETNFFNENIVKRMNCKQPLWISTTMWLQLGVGKSAGMITQSSILANSIPFRKLNASLLPCRNISAACLFPRLASPSEAASLESRLLYIHSFDTYEGNFFSFPHDQNFVCFVTVIQGGPPTHPYKRMEEGALSLSKLCDAAGIYSQPGFDLQSWETSKM